MPTDGKRESEALFKHSAAALAVDDGTGRAGMVGLGNPLPVTISGGSLGSDTSGMRVISDQPLTVGASAVSITVPEEAQYVVVEAQDGVIRFRLDGTAPTSTSGHRLIATEGVQLSRAEAQGFRAIREGSTDVSIMATAYGIPADPETP